MTEQNKPKEEEKTERLDFATLKEMPNKYSLALWKIRERLIKAVEKATMKGVKNFLEKTITDVEEFAVKLNDDFKPAPLKTINDAYDYAKSRKFSATYLALLDEKDNLVKVLIIEKNEIWKTIPTVKIEDRAVQVEMNARFVTIAGTDFGVTDNNPQGGKSVSKRVVKVVPFSTDLEKIFAYKNGEIVRA